MDIDKRMTESAAKALIEVVASKFPALVEQLSGRNRKFRPEVVLGIEGGGVFVGGMLVTNFLREAYSSDSQPLKFCVLNRVNRTEDRESVIEFPESENERISGIIRGMNVLLVDATVFTGNTMAACHKFVTACGAAKVKMATVYQGKDACISADYYSEKATKRMTLPWEISSIYREAYGRQIRVLNKHR